MAITSLNFYFGQFTLKSTHVCQIETSVYTVKCTNVLKWINIWYFKPKNKKKKVHPIERESGFSETRGSPTKESSPISLLEVPTGPFMLPLLHATPVA